jgi:Methylamine utilisation protein MauE
MLYSGFSKALDIYGFIEELKYYHHIPTRLHILIGFSIPLIEIIIGILVWIPSLRVYIITAYQVLIGIFIIFLMLHIGEYMPLGCGCFGKGNEETISYYTILRDTSFLLPAWIYLYLTRWFS